MNLNVSTIRNLSGQRFRILSIRKILFIVFKKRGAGMKNDMVQWRYFFLIPVFILLTAPASAQIYKYRDQNGMMHYTDSLSDIPLDNLPEVQIEMPVNPSPPLEKETPDTETDKQKPEKKLEDAKEIPIVEDINKEKAALDKTHVRLMKKKKALKQERETLKTPDQVRKYRKKVTRLNKDIEAYEKRNRAFQKKADAYNEAIREKGEE